MKAVRQNSESPPHPPPFASRNSAPSSDQNLEVLLAQFEKLKLENEMLKNSHEKYVEQQRKMDELTKSLSEMNLIMKQLEKELEGKRKDEQKAKERDSMSPMPSSPPPSSENNQEESNKTPLSEMNEPSPPKPRTKSTSSFVPKMDLSYSNQSCPNHVTFLFFFSS